MKEFFKHELETLQARTGIRQLETLLQKPNWEEEINALIGFMIDECNKPPFDLVTDKKVLQRVINKAVVEDPEFIGLNAKFVRRALYKWWNDNGQRVIERRDEKPAEVYQKIKLTPEENARVNTLLQSFQQSLKNGVFQQVPDVDKVEDEGKEWKSEIERKALSTKIDPERKIYTPESLKERNERIRAMQEKAFRDKNPGASEDEVQIFMEQVKRYEIKIPNSK